MVYKKKKGVLGLSQDRREGAAGSLCRKHGGRHLWQRSFQGAFHASNDYMHWYGWAPTNEMVTKILREAERLRAEHRK